MRFDKTDKIRLPEGSVWECILSDEDLAVFGLLYDVKPYGKDKKISTVVNILLGNSVDAGFEYTECVGVCEHSGVYVFEDDDYEYDADQNTYFLVKSAAAQY